MLFVSQITAQLPAAIDVVRGSLIGVSTVAVVLVIALIVGVGLLFRRRSGSVSGRISTSPELSRDAGAELIRADDAVEAAENEVGFAIAQFGAERTDAFARAAATARAQVAEAFRIQQQLDDAYPETDQQRREMTKRVIVLATSAQQTIDTQTAAFTQLRRSEADSPARLSALRQGIAAARQRIPSAAAQVQRLQQQYAPSTLASVDASIDRANALLDDAQRRADDADARISATGVNTVSTDLDAAAELVHTAQQLLAGIDTRTADLESATATLASMVAESRTDLAEARRVRDTPPDPDTGARVLAAITEVESTIAAVSNSPEGGANPVRGIERLGAAMAALDTALAGARNQQQRLEHARTALVGAVVTARSQIEEAKAVIASGRTRVDARTRLAEAERQLMLAEAESDPVEALDAARRSATAARDADALARYALL